MKPLLWDSINPFTGTPFTWDDPNLRWGDPSYYLEPGDPGFVPYPGQVLPKPKEKKKPFRRTPRPKTQPQPTQPNTMSTFRYNVAPNSNGGFTTRAHRGDPVDQTTMLDTISTAAGVTPAQAESVLRSFFDQVLAATAVSGWTPSFLDTLTFRPTSGGSSPTPEGFHNADDLNADVALSFLAPKIAAWRSSLSIQSLGEVGKVLPIVESVIRQSDSAAGKYTAGGLIQLRGNHLNFDKTDLTQGVFLKPGSGAEVRVTEYATIQPQSVIVLVPTGLTGPLTLRVAAYINGSVRTSTYTDPLTTP